MRIIASVAITSDGCMDDSSPRRLTISNQADWHEVYALREQVDAILVGANTIRCDNPSLVIKTEESKRRRVLAGLNAEITKVVLSESLEIDLDARFFTVGTGRKIVVSPNANCAHFGSCARVLNVERISARSVVEALEREGGVDSLLIEGGALTLGMFLRSGLVDRLRVATNTRLTLGDESAPHFDVAQFDVAKHLVDTYYLDEMKIEEYKLSQFETDKDSEYMSMALEQSLKSEPVPSSYRVGAVLITRAGEVFCGYTHKTSPTHHAEQEVIYEAESQGADLRGATIYSTMEPCSQRKSEPKSCTDLILESGIARVVFAMYEPDCFVKCNGAKRLRDSGVRVDVMSNYAASVAEINKHIIQKTI